MGHCAEAAIDKRQAPKRTRIADKPTFGRLIDLLAIPSGAGAVDDHKRLSPVARRRSTVSFRLPLPMSRKAG